MNKIKRLKSLLFLLFCVVSLAQQKTEVFFDFNKDYPNSDSNEQFLKWMKEHQSVEILKVYAYCDSVDVNSYNKNLAERRMQSVIKILKVNDMFVSSNLDVKAIGEDFEQSKNQAENRKVEVFYKNNSDLKPYLQPVNVSENNKEKEDKSLNIPLVDLFKNVKTGDIVRIQNINFFFNSENVIPQSEYVLQELFQVMINHPKLVIEIQGHICCNPDVMDTKLSFRRAMYIFNYLRKKGIELNRLAFKGFGSSRPIYPIPEKNYKEEQANRRVEILIVKNE